MNNENAMPGALAEALAEEEAARAAFLKEAEAEAARVKRLEAENERLTREVADRAKELNAATTLAVDNSKKNKNTWQKATEILKNGAVAVLVVALLVGGAYFFLWGENITTAGVSDRRIADIAGATFDQRIKPIEGDIKKLQSDTSDLKTSFADLDIKAGEQKKMLGEQKDVLADIKKLLEKRGDGPVAANDSIEAKRLVQLKTECLPQASVGVSVGENLSEEAFQKYLNGCRAAKQEAILGAEQSGTSPSGPQVAARTPETDSDDAEGDEPAASDDEAEGTGAVRTGRYDPRTMAAMGDPRIAQVGYRGGPDFGRPGMGRGRGHPHARGVPRCPRGSDWNPQYGKCVGTKFHHLPVSPERQAELASCQKIETRMVMRGNRLVEQQRGVACVGRRSH